MTAECRGCRGKLREILRLREEIERLQNKNDMRQEPRLLAAVDYAREQRDHANAVIAGMREQFDELCAELGVTTHWMAVAKVRMLQLRLSAQEQTLAMYGAKTFVARLEPERTSPQDASGVK